MTTYAPIPIYDALVANSVVVEQIDRLNGLADQVIAQAQSMLGELGSYEIAESSLDPRLTWNQDDLEALVDQLGTIPDADLSTNWLDSIDLSGGNDDFVFSPALLAKLSEELPDYILPPAPSLPAMPDAPADPGEPGEEVAPTEPTLPHYDAPEVDTDTPLPSFEDFTSTVPFPALREIVLPTAPQLSLDTLSFDKSTPEFTAAPPDVADYDLTVREYDPLVVTEIKTAVLDVLQGSRGINPDVEAAMFERARERESELGARAIQKVTEDYANKNYKYPPGALAARKDRAEKDANDKISQINREQFVEGWRLAVEQFRAVLANAIALEEMWAGVFTATEGLRITAVKAQLEAAIQVFDAFVTKFNAEVALRRLSLDIVKAELEVEMGKLDVYAKELQAKQLIGELNAQDVQIFAERLKALSVNATIYEARVRGYVAQFEAVNAKADIYGKQLDGNKTLADIFDTKTRAYAARVQAQGLRDERFKTKAQIFSTKTDAVKAQYEMIRQDYDANFKIAELQRDTFVANSERIREYIAAESGRINALVSKYQALASEINAKSDVEKSRYALLLSFATAQIERMKAAADILLKNGEIKIQSALQASNFMLRGKETAATGLAQLAAGLTSAANVNASISDGYNQSVSYSYSGELNIN